MNSNLFCLKIIFK